MEASDRDLMTQATTGDEEAFAQLVIRHQTVLKSYLYRLTACREDAEDLAQEVWIHVFTRLATYTGRTSVRTWLFAMTTELAVGHPRVQARWPLEAQEKAKALASSDPEVDDFLQRTHWESPRARYEMREHIDFCFTCILKTLPLDEHLAFMLSELYDLTTDEIAEVLGSAPAEIDRLLQQARATMTDFFGERCGLIRQQGACQLCPEFNHLFNPYQSEPQELAKLELVQAAQATDPPDLMTLRLALVRSIDPLNAAGTNLHEAIMRLVRQASGTE
jgi:RNA polymerase sigma-70 factor (ECF subfamily)